VENVDGMIRVTDARHGVLQVPSPGFTAALRRTEGGLRQVLAGLPWLRLTGDEPIATLAALAATHLPVQLGTVAEPGSGPPAAAGPDVPDAGPRDIPGPPPPAGGGGVPPGQVEL
jgi:hypothetical protein